MYFCFLFCMWIDFREKKEMMKIKLSVPFWCLKAHLGPFSIVQKCVLSLSLLHHLHWLEKTKWWNGWFHLWSVLSDQCKICRQLSRIISYFEQVEQMMSRTLAVCCRGSLCNEKHKALCCRMKLLGVYTVEVGSFHTLRLESLKLVFQPLHKFLVNKL